MAVGKIKPCIKDCEVQKHCHDEVPMGVKGGKTHGLQIQFFWLQRSTTTTPSSFCHVLCSARSCQCTRKPRPLSKTSRRDAWFWHRCEGGTEQLFSSSRPIWPCSGLRDTSTRIQLLLLPLLLPTTDRVELPVPGIRRPTTPPALWARGCWPLNYRVRCSSVWAGVPVSDPPSQRIFKSLLLRVCAEAFKKLMILEIQALPSSIIQRRGIHL